jgi:hypothetical protein
MRIRDKIAIGTIFTKSSSKKQYVVTNVWFDCGGNIMIVNYVKCGEDLSSRLLYVNEMVDEDIEKVNIIKY